MNQGWGLTSFTDFPHTATIILHYGYMYRQSIPWCPTFRPLWKSQIPIGRFMATLDMSETPSQICMAAATKMSCSKSCVTQGPPGPHAACKVFMEAKLGFYEVYTNLHINTKENHLAYDLLPKYLPPFLLKVPNFHKTIRPCPLNYFSG
jgi:hypothetical protein